MTRPRGTKGAKPAGAGSRPRKRTSRSAKRAPRAAAPAEQTGIIGAAALAEDGAASSSANDRALLETSRTRWQYGEWAELAEIDLKSIAQHPDRAKLALLAGAAQLHLGDSEAACASIRQAKDWGCGRQLIARVLVSMVHNSLGRLAASLEEDDAATRHFEEAIGLVETRADAGLMARTRRVRETARMGLLPDAAALLEKELSAVRADAADRPERLERLAADVKALSGAGAPASKRKKPGGAWAMVKSVPESQSAFSQSPRFDAEAFVYLRDRAPNERRSFVFLEVKSLPRAGLHFLKNTLTSVIHDALSFCEWYQEPGCCERMPCSRSRYLAEGRGRVLIRMSKSHDFDLADPAYPTNATARRIILVRDPLYVLTSWWSLDLLAQHPAMLRESGIDPIALFYRHERSILAAAYQAIQGATASYDAASVRAWAERRKPYILGFVEKWHVAEAGAQGAFARLVHYHDAPRVAGALLDELSESLSDEETERLKAFLDAPESRFTPRADPFEGPTAEITAFLRAHAHVFETSAAELIDADETGVLAGASRSRAHGAPQGAA